MVLEDSSKSYFGGGQRVTLSVMEAMRSASAVVLFDHVEDSVFLSSARPLARHAYTLRTHGRMVNASGSSFSLGWREIISLPGDVARAAAKVRRTLNGFGGSPHNAVLYCATKRTALIGFVLHVFHGYRYYFHAHSFDSRRSPWFWLMRIPLLFAAKIICVSKTVMRNDRTHNSVVLYNPVHSEISHVLRHIGEKVDVAVFTSLLLWKGVAYFLSSYAFLRNPKTVSFHVYGVGPEEGDLRRRFQGVGIYFHGFVNDAPAVMDSLVDIVVVPSIAPEACPMTPLEAFLRGIPVIATRLGGQAEIVRDGSSGILVPPRDPRALACAIDALIEDPLLYRALSGGALQRARDFDEGIFADKIREIVQWE